MSGREELLKMIDEEDKQEPIEDEQDAEETEEVATEESEGDNSEESDDSEEVDGIDFDDEKAEDQGTKYTPEQALVHKLTKEKKKRQEIAATAEDLASENERLKRQLAEIEKGKAPQPTQSVPKVPVMYEDGINTVEQYNQAMAEYWQQQRQMEAKQAEAAAQKQREAEQTQERANRLSERAKNFITSNKIKSDKAVDEITAGVQGLDEMLGIEGTALKLLDTVGEGSEKVAYWLGRNPNALNTVKELVNEDPYGFKLVHWLTVKANEFNSKSLAKNRISKAPEPDEPLRGDGNSSEVAKSLQAQYDKAKDYDELVKIRAKAKAAGIKLKS